MIKYPLAFELNQDQQFKFQYMDMLHKKGVDIFQWQQLSDWPNFHVLCHPNFHRN